MINLSRVIVHIDHDKLLHLKLLDLTTNIKS